MLPAAATFPHRRLRSSQAEQARAFIVIKTDGDVELLELGGAGKTSPLEGVVEAIPGVIGKIKDLVGKKNSDSADESDDAE